MNISKIIRTERLNFPWQTQDPFLFCAYHNDHYPAGNAKMAVNPDQLQGREIGSDFIVKDGYRMYHGNPIPGFPNHPHRGFETVTINKQGTIDHSDSMGALGRFAGGDVQWMTAGKGIQHAEMFPLVNENESNPLELFQVWLNLPKADKFVEPSFKMLWREDVPTVTHTDNSGRTTTIDIVAGEYKQTKALTPTPNSWAAKAEHEVTMLTVRMDAKATWTMPAASRAANRTIYFYRGDTIAADGETIQEEHLMYVVGDQDFEITNGDTEGFLLILQGRPINEPVVQYGPFVMNTKEEIQQAYSDYRKTQFGGWPWPSESPVHERTKGRFALHADGKKEIK